MASSDQRSISGSHNIPFSRNPTDAFQDMTAFTPPPENWLANYSKTSKKEESANQSVSNKTSKFIVPKANELDDPCKRYIESSEIPVKSNKSLGTDDHFKSAYCSKNLLKVCEKLMLNKDIVQQHQQQVSSFASKESLEDDFDAELSLMNEKSRMEFYRSKYGNRRNSQSLPASPKMERKQPAPVSHNPYFTISKQDQSSRPESGISFLTSLFGITVKNPKEAQANLAQKYEVSSANNNSSYQGGDTQQQQSKQSPGSRQLTPQPHPYREMNIFSPTSM